MHAVCRPSETQGFCSRTLSSAAMCAPYLSIASQLQCPLFSVYFVKTNVGTFHMSPLPDGTILPSASRRVGGGLQEEAVLLLGSGRWLTRFPLSSGFSSSGPECRGVSSTSKPAAARHSGAFAAQWLRGTTYNSQSTLERRYPAKIPCSASRAPQ